MIIISQTRTSALIAIATAALLLVNCCMCDENSNSSSLNMDDDLNEERSGSSMNDLWHQYKTRHSHSFNPVEERVRYQIFRSNYNYIREHNRQFASGRKSYRLGLNRFAHMSDAEYRTQLLGYKARTDLRTARSINQSEIQRLGLLQDQRDTTLPENFNYRSMVTPPRNQGNCGSCWAFSAAAVTEILYAKANNVLTYFSVQQLLDCDTGDSSYDGNQGCEDSAFAYIQKNGLIEDTRYGYKGMQGHCGLQAGSGLYKVNGHIDLPERDEVRMKKAVAKHGPLTIGLDASTRDFRFYAGGVFNDPTCGSTFNELNHAMVIIGYGRENNRDYWYIKNSYGQAWGESGFLKIERNKNACGVSILPTLAY